MCNVCTWNWTWFKKNQIQKVLEFWKDVIKLKSIGSKFEKPPLKPLQENLHINLKNSKPDQRFSQNKRMNCTTLVVRAIHLPFPATHKMGASINEALTRYFLAYCWKFRELSIHTTFRLCYRLVLKNKDSRFFYHCFFLGVWVFWIFLSFRAIGVNK
jgi:hypothetical protein